MAHADTTLIFASAAHIASELGSLKNASWLAVAYTLAVCSTQPLYGKLCDVFGRKPVLLSAYTILSVGCVLCGTSTRIWQIVGGRVISGIGGAGVMTMASIVITDSVPKREIATYRSYINMATTLGRSVGGPLGGLIADKLGWQWLFFLRIPVFAVSILLLSLSLKQKHDPEAEEETIKVSFSEKLAKVDFIGAFLLSSTITLCIVLVDEAGAGHITPLSLIMVALAGVFGNLFFFRQMFISKEPILDLRILARPNAALSYLINYLQVFAQVGMMFSVPMYFQVTQRASTTAAGAHLVPAVVANTAGALLSGAIIRKTQKFKPILIGTGLLGTVTYFLLFGRWNGPVSEAESLYIVPAGLATGMAQSAAFVSMASLLSPSQVAMATGVYFLTSSLGTVTGVTTTNLLISSFFKANLEEALPGSASLDVSSTAPRSSLLTLVTHVPTSDGWLTHPLDH